jgi:hypothetical protein
MSHPGQPRETEIIRQTILNRPSGIFIPGLHPSLPIGHNFTGSAAHTYVFIMTAVVASPSIEAA